MKWREKYIILVFLVGLLAGLLFSRAWIFVQPDAESTAMPISQKRLDNKYELINPLLFCGVSEDKEFEEFDQLETQVEALINKNIVDDSADKVSVYYRVMDSGQWFGINENETYSPASLLKIPVMIAYLKEAESNPGLLYKWVFYDGSFDYNQFEYFFPKVSIQPGRSYTINELLEAMIVYSGNNSEKLLLDRINPKIHMEVFADLGVPNPEDATAITDFMSAKLYGYFFRVLYNASYLNTEMSQKALNMLTKARFDHGIAKGVPDNVKVAEKFGERTAVDYDNNILWRELHDCGIIYDKESPYLLCVMTRGEDYEKLGEAINEISELIYKNR